MVQRNQTKKIPLSRLVDSPYNVRIIKDEEVRGLADSIDNKGLLQPLVVKELENGTYEVLGGKRRKAACKLIAAGHPEFEDPGLYCVVIPCDIETDEQYAAVATNIHVLENTEFEKSHEKGNLVKAYKKRGKREEDLAREMGVSVAVVRQWLSFAKLVDKVRDQVNLNNLEKAELVASFSKEKQPDVFEVINKEGIDNVTAKLIVRRIQARPSDTPQECAEAVLNRLAAQEDYTAKEIEKPKFPPKSVNVHLSGPINKALDDARRELGLSKEDYILQVLETRLTDDGFYPIKIEATTTAK